MISSFNFSKLRNDEHIQFIKDVLKIIETNDPDALLVKLLWDILKEKNILCENAYLLLRKSELTKKIVDKDDRRDNDATGIKKIVEGYIHHYENDKAEAAELILSHMNKYGSNIAKMNYQAETTAITDLTEYVKNDPKMKAAADLLFLTDWFNALEQANIEFNELYMLRIDEQAGKNNDNLKELRAETVSAYNELIKHLSAHALITPSELYEKTTNMINELIDKYSSLRKKQREIPAE